MISWDRFKLAKGPKSTNLPCKPLIVCTTDSFSTNFCPHSFQSNIVFLHKFPFTQLSVQYCMHRDICSLVNKRIYNNRLQNNDSIADRTRNGDWDMFLISWLPVLRLSGTISPNLLFLNVSDGEDVRGQLSCPWSNTANVNVVASFLFSWYKYAQSRLKPKLKVVILVPYKDQKILYQERMLRLAQTLGCPAEHLADISTIDGFQGRESSVVILDLVRTKNLGFLEQEPRATVAFSRCRDSFIIVGNTTITEKREFRSWKDTKKTSEGISVDNPKPSVIWYIEELARRNLIIEQEGNAHAVISLQKSPEKKDKEHNNEYGKWFQAKPDLILIENYKMAKEVGPVATAYLPWNC